MWAWIKNLWAIPNAVETSIKIAEKATDGVIKGIDKSWFTTEEKSDAIQKSHETILKFWEQFGKENSAQSVARRTMAFWVVELFIFVVLVGVVMISFGRTDFVTSMMSFLNAVGFEFVVGSVIITYFAPYQLSRIWPQKEKEKKDGD